MKNLKKTIAIITCVAMIATLFTVVSTTAFAKSAADLNVTFEDGTIGAFVKPNSGTTTYTTAIASNADSFSGTYALKFTKSSTACSTMSGAFDYQRVYLPLNNLEANTDYQLSFLVKQTELGYLRTTVSTGTSYDSASILPATAAAYTNPTCSYESDTKPWIIYTENNDSVKKIFSIDNRQTDSWARYIYNFNSGANSTAYLNLFFENGDNVARDVFIDDVVLKKASDVLEGNSNGVANSGFETGEVSPFVQRHDNSGRGASGVSPIAHTGNYSLKITKKAATAGDATHAFSDQRVYLPLTGLTKNTDYRFSFWVKQDTIGYLGTSLGTTYATNATSMLPDTKPTANSESAQAPWIVQDKNHGMLPLFWIDNHQTDEWVRYTYSFNSGDYETLYFSFFYDYDSKYTETPVKNTFIDDIMLAKSSDLLKDNNNGVANSGFETGAVSPFVQKHNTDRTTSTVSAIAHSGNYSLKFTKKKPTCNSASVCFDQQRVYLPLTGLTKNTDYRFSFWVKQDTVGYLGTSLGTTTATDATSMLPDTKPTVYSESSQAPWIVQDKSHGMLPLFWIDNHQTDEWVRYTYSFNSGDYETLYFNFFYDYNTSYAETTVKNTFIDDLHLWSAPEDIVANGDFESGSCFVENRTDAPAYGTIATTNDEAYEGNSSLKYTTTATKASTIAGTLTYSTIYVPLNSLKANTYYSFKFFMKADTNQYIYTRLANGNAFKNGGLTDKSLMICPPEFESDYVGTGEFDVAATVVDDGLSSYYGLKGCYPIRNDQASNWVEYEYSFYTGAYTDANFVVFVPIDTARTPANYYFDLVTLKEITFPTMTDSGETNVPCRIGDIDNNGRIGASDLTYMVRYILGTLNEEVAIKIIDVNGDNSVNILDLVALKKYLAGTSSLLGKKLTASKTVALSVNNTAGNEVTTNYVGTSGVYYPFDFIKNDELTTPYTAEELAWEVAQLKAMNVSMVRTFIYPEWSYNASTKQWDFNSEYMQGFYDYCDMLKENGIDITVAIHGVGQLRDEKLYNGYMTRAIPDLVGSEATLTQSVNAFADWFAQFANQVINVKGYDNLKYFIVSTEPSNDVVNETQTVQKEKFDEIKALAKAVDSALTTANLRSNIKLVGPSVTTGSENGNYPATAARFVDWTISEIPEIDIISVHHYTHYTDWTEDQYNFCTNWLTTYKAKCDAAGKELWIDETNATLVQNASAEDQIAAHFNPLKGTAIALNILAGMNGGANTNCIWALNNQKVGFEGFDSNFGVDTNGLVPYFRFSRVNNPEFYAFSILGQLVKKGATIYAGTYTEDGVYTALVENTDGTKGFVVINMKATNCEFNINLASSLGGANLSRYLYNPETVKCSADNTPIDFDISIGGVTTTLNDVLPAYSVAVYVTK